MLAFQTLYIFINVKCVCVCTCMSVYYMCAEVYRPEEGFGFFGAGNQTHILCKGSQWAEVLSRLFSGLHFFAQSLTYLRLASNLLCSRGWPWTSDPPSSASWVLWLQACATTPRHYCILCKTLAGLERLMSTCYSCQGPELSFQHSGDRMLLASKAHTHPLTYTYS